jgi:glycosyltransferase involved in cell wall biosynthesis
MTKVLIDARGLGDASSFRGIGTYLRHTLEGLATKPGLSVSALALDGTSLPDGVRRVRLHRHAPGRFASFEHELLLPLDLLRSKADVVHSPAQDPPWRCRQPWVQTIHGVAPLVVEHEGFKVERRRLERQRSRLARADAVITVSRDCADQAIAWLGLEPAKMHVIHHGVDGAFHPRRDRPTTDPPYILYVGEFGPTKGYPEAFAVVGRLAEAGYPHRLRVAGRIAPWTADEVGALVAQAPRPDRIDLLDHVDHLGELPGELQGASSLIVTSRYESFCLPIAEAMACGTPVVAFANTAISEIVGNGGVLVPDGDVAALVANVRSLLDSGHQWQELSERALARATAFDWERSVDAHAEVLEAVARRC